MRLATVSSSPHTCPVYLPQCIIYEGGMKDENERMEENHLWCDRNCNLMSPFHSPPPSTETSSVLSLLAMSFSSISSIRKTGTFSYVFHQNWSAFLYSGNLLAESRQTCMERSITGIRSEERFEVCDGKQSVKEGKRSFSRLTHNSLMLFYSLSSLPNWSSPVSSSLNSHGND